MTAVPDLFLDETDVAPMPEEMMQAILSGVAVLDVARPDWHHQIDVDRLLMRNDQDCILAQLFGTYAGGLNELSSLRLYAAARWAADNGFTVRTAGLLGQRDPFSDLTIGWQALIVSRRQREVAA